MAELVRYQTPVFRMSFPHLFKAESVDGGEPKYGLSAVWTPADFTPREKKLWARIEKAMNDECKARFKKNVDDMPSNFKYGIRDGKDKADLEGYGKGTLFASLTTKMRPGVVDREKDPISPDEGNEDEIYPGCYARATVVVYSYDNKSKGVSLGLMNVQKVKDGERLDSRTDAADDFDDDFLDDDDDTEDFLDD